MLNFYVIVVVLVIMVVGYLSYLLGWYRGHKRMRVYQEKAARYAIGVSEFIHWCSHIKQEYRLIGEHLRTVGEGGSMNAGTPIGNEVCTIDGLREQLKRLDKFNKNPEGVTNDALQKLRFLIQSMQDQRQNKRASTSDIQQAVILKTDVLNAISKVAEELFIKHGMDPDTKIQTAVDPEVQDRQDALTLLSRKLRRRTGQNFFYMGKMISFLPRESVIELVADALDHAEFKKTQRAEQRDIKTDVG